MAALVLVGVAACVVGSLGYARAVLTAAVRAVGQLAAVSFVLAAIVEIEPLTLAFILVMVGTATVTAGRRMTPNRSGLWTSVPIVVATAPVVVALLVGGVLPSRPLAVIPVSGILIGGAMTATALAGRRALDELASRSGEVEAALSVGLLPRDATLEICRPAAAGAMIPVLDQTRTVGLVTLPGAFVGMLVGGADPVEAGAFQVFVLIGLMAVEAVAVTLTVELIARGAIARPS
ncbi:putative ABC transport system permease protein [Haloactinopolyspora alba]|uniref:Putative ABC transport system permease protein n=1 Tax=Haloactinopolyspora alba TaxID=648780 RepID=A0A2P8EFG0_9ACTN|nr:putative ABC transport system permease protein [Haloactinopolyspora alba]